MPGDRTKKRRAKAERDSDRVEVTWPIRYERRATGRWSETRDALCVNVGGSGMLLLVNELPEQNELIRLHMRDANRDLPFTLAQVRWSKAQKMKDHTAVVGIEYVDPDAA